MRDWVGSVQQVGVLHYIRTGRLNSPTSWSGGSVKYVYESILNLSGSLQQVPPPTLHKNVKIDQSDLREERRPKQLVQPHPDIARESAAGGSPKVHKDVKMYQADLPEELRPKQFVDKHAEFEWDSAAGGTT